MSQKMTQSTSLSEDTLSDESLLLDRWGTPNNNNTSNNHLTAPGAFAESPIPEEASFLSSEGFQGDRIQGELSYLFVSLLCRIVQSALEQRNVLSVWLEWRELTQDGRSVFVLFWETQLSICNCACGIVFVVVVFFSLNI